MISDGRNRCFLDFYNADYCSMISIKDIDWSLLCSNCLSVEVLWSKISNVLHSCIAKFIPRHNQSRKPFSYPKHIRHLLAMKKVRYSKDRVRFTCICFARLYDEAVSSCLRNCLSSFYSYVNSKLATSQSIPPLVESNNKLAVSNHDKCIVLNDYFASVFTTDDLLPIAVFPSRLPVGESLDTVLFSFDNVFKALKSWPSKCSTTPDGFLSVLLKSLAPAMAFPLSLLCDTSMRMGHTPLVWKTALVCPVFKKGSRQLSSKDLFHKRAFLVKLQNVYHSIFYGIHC